MLQCLAKLPSDRPTDAADLLRKLDACPVAGTWTAADAATWWAEGARITQTTDGATIQVPRDLQMPAPDVTMAFQGDGGRNP